MAGATGARPYRREWFAIVRHCSAAEQQGRDFPSIESAQAATALEMMIGTSVPQQVELKDIPPEVTEIADGFCLS